MYIYILHNVYIIYIYASPHYVPEGHETGILDNMFL